MSEENWGPWTKHVPGPCPVPVGTYIEVHMQGGLIVEGRVEAGPDAYGDRHPSWYAKNDPFTLLILRYRVRMDREHSGMSVLRSLLNGIPVKETEDA